MPTSKKGRRKHNHPKPKPKLKTKPPGPMSSCTLPHHLLLNIFSRLPVKSLLRFRCVCKPFRTLFRNPKFIQTHLLNTSSNPQNNSFIIHTIRQNSSDHILSLFPTNQTDPQDLDHPFPIFFLEMDILGSINGIVCICKPPWGDVISIWNPATKQSKGVTLSGTKPDPSVHDKVSMGFAFDSVKNDYKVISVLCFKHELKIPARVEVYSANSSSWKKLATDCPFVFVETCCAAIVKGMPYWPALIQDDLLGVREVFVYFDVGSEVFGKVLFPVSINRSKMRGRLVDLNDSLALIVSSKNEEVEKFVDVWMMDDDGEIGCWSKKFTIGPIFGMKSLVGCLKNCEIVAEDGEGKLFLYDPETRGVKYMHIDGAVFEVFNYNESLVSVKGATSLRKSPFEEAALAAMLRIGIHVKIS